VLVSIPDLAGTSLVAFYQHYCQMLKFIQRYLEFGKVAQD
jgi:hypothetical protein